jgi:hypothetical protein
VDRFFNSKIELERSQFGGLCRRWAWSKRVRIQRRGMLVVDLLDRLVSHHGLYQIVVVRGGLGVWVGGCLGVVCLATVMSGTMGLGLVASCSRIFFCLCAMMPRSMVCAKEQNLLRRVFAIL